MSDLSNLRINGPRLWEALMEMAKIGGTPKGGCKRLTLTDLDKQGRELFIGWCESAGCKVSVDAMGNLFARRPGTDNALPPVVMGSHLDTQPTGASSMACSACLARWRWCAHSTTWASRQNIR